MSPDNDFNVYRVESLGQIAGLKPIGPGGQRKRRENTAKKRSDEGEQVGEEAVQPPAAEGSEETGADKDDEHSIDYCA